MEKLACFFPEKEKIANIRCYLILGKTAYKLTITPINTVEIYISIMCICHKYIYYSMSVINSQHSMLDFHKETPLYFICFGSKNIQHSMLGHHAYNIISIDK